MKKILCLAIAATLACCAPRKAIAETEKPMDVHAPARTDATATFIGAVTKKAAFGQIKITGKVDMQNGKFSPDAIIYIEDGQKVWVNLSVLFFNAARGIATPQGIKAYEKLNKTYIDSDFGYLNKMLGINFLDYSALQNLLLGRTFLPIDNEGYTLTKNAAGYTLSSNKNQKVVKDGKTYEYKVSLDYAADYALQAATIQDAASTQTLHIRYGNRIMANTINIPQSIEITVKGVQNTGITINYTKFESGTMEAPFAIPPNYTKTVIK